MQALRRRGPANAHTRPHSALQNFSVKADVGKVLDIREGELDKETLDKRLGV